MQFFRQSLRGKLIVAFGVPTLVIVALYGFLAYFASRQGLEDELGERLISIGQTQSAQWSDGFDAKQIARLDVTKQRVIARMHDELVTVANRTKVRRIYVFDQKHQSLVDSDPAVQFGSKLYELEAHRLETGRVFEQNRPAASVLFQGPDGLPYKMGFVPVTHEGRVVAAIGVEASASYFVLLTEFASALTVLAFLAILLIVLAATVFSRRLVAPINRLVEAARRLGRGELDKPVQTSDGQDEIAFLSRAFEDMRRDIVGRDQQMQMMLSGIAHEVRNPLGGMELFCGLLAEDLRAEEESDVHREMLDKVGKIQRELDYLDRVVNDFLDFARDTPPQQERFDAADFVCEVVDLLRGELAASGCEVRPDLQEGSAVELTADRGRLRRALINVVRNAGQACGEGGHVTIGVQADGDKRVISVADDGPGIEPEVQAQILDPFFTTREKGSGLGLALTQRIVRSHAGELEIDSTLGAGTTVRFILPFDDTIEAATSAIPEGWLG